MKIGIDIGGSHIGIGLVENNGTIVLKKEIYIKDKTDIENRIERYITENVIEILQAYGVNQIGIAVPGTVTDKEIIKAVNLGIKNYEIGTIIRENLLKLGYTVDVKLKNDGKCAALAEQKYITENTVIIVEAKLDRNFDFLNELGFEVTREKNYKTNKHVFCRKVS